MTKISDDRDRQHHLQLRRATPCTPRTRRPTAPSIRAAAAPACRHLLLRLLHRAREIASLHRVLHADEARVVLPVDERRTVRDLNVGELAQRHLLAIRRRRRECCRSASGVSRYCGSSRTTRSNVRSPCTTWSSPRRRRPRPRSTHSHRRRSRRSARSSRDRSVTVRLGCPSSCTSVTWLMPRTESSTCFTSRPFDSSVARSSPNIFTSSELLSPVSRLVHRVFRGLRVVEGDPRERGQLLVDRLDQLRPCS